MKIWYEIRVKTACGWEEIASFYTQEKAQEVAKEWIKEVGKPKPTNWIRIVKCERIKLKQGYEKDI